MTGEGESVETPPVETATAREAENIQKKLLGIVKNRLGKITKPPQEKPEKPESQEQKERQNTAQALLNILEGSEKPMASFTTTLKPIEEQPPPTTESESPEKQAPPQEEPTSTPSEKPQEPPPPEKPQPVTYKNVRIEGNTVIAVDPQGNEVKFSLLELVGDMAETVGLPPHQIEIIKAQLEGAQLNEEQLESLARKSGFFTREFLCELFDIPTNKEERQMALNNPDIPDQVKKVIGEIDNLPPLPDAEQVCQVLFKASLPIDISLSQIINKIKIPDNLPQEQKNALNELIGIARKSIQKEKVENQTLSQLITNYYQQLEAGEDVAVDLPEIIDSLVALQPLKQNINENQKKDLINKIKNAVIIGGGLPIALLLIFLLKGAGEMTGGSSH